MENIFRGDFGDDVENAAESLASKLLNKKMLEKIGQIGAFAGVGYGAYKFANSSVGMSVSSAASQTIGNVYDDVGYTFGEMSASQDAYGRAYNPSQRSYDLANQAVNEATAGGFGAMAGVGTTATALGGGMLLSKLGLGGALNTAASGIGSAAGSAIGTGAFSAAGTLANAGLSSIGMSGAGNLAAQGLGFIGGGAGSALGAIGGFAGTMALPLAGAAAAQKLADNFTDQIAYQRQAETAIQEMSYRFTPGMATNAVTGRGLNYRDSAELAQSARGEMADNLYMRQGDLDEVLAGMTEGDLMYNVRGAEEFQDKFEKVTKSLRDISRIYGTTLKESTEMLGEMQRSGFYTTADQTEMLLQSDAIGRMTGYTGREVVQIGSQGAQTARQLGLGKQLGYDTATMTSLAIEEEIQNLSGDDRQILLENIQELGGKEQATASASNAMLGLTQKKEFQSALFGLLNEDGEINQEQLDRMISGDMSLKEAMGRGANLVANDKEMRAEYYTNAPNYFEKLEGPEFIQVMSRMVEGFQETTGMGDQGFDIENTLKNLGIEDKKLREIIAGAIKSSGVIDQNELTRRTLQQQLREDKLERRSLSGVMERISNWFAEKGQDIAEGSGVTDAYQNVKAGLLEFWNENVKDIRTVGEFDLGEANLGLDLSTEGIESLTTGAKNDISRFAPGNTLRQTELNDALIQNPQSFRDKRGNLNVMAQHRLAAYTGESASSYNWMQNRGTTAADIFTKNFKENTAVTLAENLGSDTITLTDENGAEQDYTYEEYARDFLGYSDEQTKVFTSLVDKAQGMYDDAMGNIIGPAKYNTDVQQRQKDNIAREVMGFLEGQNKYSGGMHAINANEIFEGMLTGDYSYQMAAGNERAGEVLKGITQTDNSIESEIRTLYDNQAAANGLTDEQLIESLENENQKSILNTGLRFNKGELGLGGVLKELEGNSLFRDRDLSGLKEIYQNIQGLDPSEYSPEELQTKKAMYGAEFNKLLDNVLSQEFISTVVEKGQTSYHMASEDDWIEKWEEVIKEGLLKSHDDIIESNGKVNETLQRLESSIDSLDKNIEKDIDFKNLNNGAWNLGPN